MMDGRCGTCKWWTQISTLDDPEADALGHGIGVCMLSAGDDSGPQHEGAVFVAVAQSGGKALLKTGSIFGCTEHEPKDTDAKPD